MFLLVTSCLEVCSLPVVLFFTAIKHIPLDFIYMLV